MKRHFIVNKNAGNGSALMTTKKIVSLCENHKLIKGKDFFVHFPESKEETEEIAREYSDLNHQVNQDSDVIIYSVGGDGTRLSVGNGMIGSGAKLSTFPCGSGNDYLRSIKPDTKYVDIGYVNGTYFFNIASIGLDENVLEYTYETRYNKSQKNGGKSSKADYLPGIYKAIKNYQYTDIKINGVDQSITILTICKGGWYGGGIGINKNNYNLNDGKFQVYQVGRFSNRGLTALAFGTLAFGLHEKLRVVTRTETDRITIEADDIIPYQLDGELFSNNKLEFQVVPNAIEIIPPEKDKIFIKKY